MIEISIIMPAYNCEKYIRDAIQSAIDQDFPKDRYEIIIVDDCSTDRTGKIAEEYAKKYKNIKVIHHKKNVGETNAIRTGLKNMSKTSKFICHLDGDDMYEPNKLSEQYKYLREHPEVDVIYSDGWYINEDGTKKWEYNLFPFDSKRLRRFNCISEGSVFMRREAMEAVGGPDNHLLGAEDYDLWLMIDEAGFKIEKQPNFRSYRFRQHGKMKSKTLPEYEKYLKMIRKKHGIELPLVTIGTMIHNTPKKYIRECLDSIKAQDYKNIEVIVVDNASDNKEEVEKLTKEYGFRYVYEPIKGIARARNAVIDNAKGEFIYYISSDDALMPNTISLLVNHAYDEAFYYSDYIIINENSQPVQEFRAPHFNSQEDMIMNVIEISKQDRMWITYNIWGPTKLWKENPFDDSYTENEDLEHLLRCLVVHKIKFIHIPSFLFKYRVSNQMTTQQIGWDKIRKNNDRTRRKINRLLKKEVFKNV